MLREIIKKKYIIRIANTERQELNDLVLNGRAAAYRRIHAQILLLADESDHGPSLRDIEIAEPIGIHDRTVSRLRQRCVEQGLETVGQRQLNLAGALPHAGMLTACWLPLGV